MFTFVANPPNLANRGVHSYVNVAGSRLAGTVGDVRRGDESRARPRSERLWWCPTAC